MIRDDEHILEMSKVLPPSEFYIGFSHPHRCEYISIDIYQNFTIESYDLCI